MSPTRKMILRAAIAIFVVFAVALAIRGVRRYALYEFTNSEGVRGEPIDQPYTNPVLSTEADRVDSDPTAAAEDRGDDAELADEPGPTTTVGEVAATPPTISSASDVAGPDEVDAPDSVPLRIAVAGDVGTGGDAEYATAASMDRIEGNDEYAALLLLGDNVYPDGDPADVERKVHDPFSSVLDGDTQLLPVLGNHDNDDGYGDEQVAALGMPGRWYATTIDNTLIVSLDSNHFDDTDQLAWLDATLAANESTWTIVQFHHPPYSGGWHGSDEGVRDAFVPLFEEHGVDLVMSGHDHDYQRTRPINGVTYIVSGAAAKLRDANLADFSEIAVSTYHFVDLTITPDRIEVRTVGHDDRIFDHVTLLAS